MLTAAHVLLVASAEEKDIGRKRAGGHGRSRGDGYRGMMRERRAATRLAAALVTAGLVTGAAGLSSCGGRDLSGGPAADECRTGIGGGQCLVSLDLTEGHDYDYVVHQRSLPVLGGGVQVSAHVQAGPASLRVWWRDAAGRDVATVIGPGRSQTLSGTAAVQDQAGEQRFVVHFRRPAGSGRMDATISYG